MILCVCEPMCGSEKLELAYFTNDFLFQIIFQGLANAWVWQRPGFKDMGLSAGQAQALKKSRPGLSCSATKKNVLLKKRSARLKIVLRDFLVEHY